MNILQVVSYFVPAWDYGGPVQVAYRLSKEAVKRGHQVTVYTTDALNAIGRLNEKEEVIDGIKVKRFRNLSNTLVSKHSLALPIGMLSAVRRTLPKSFDVIHLHEYRTMQNVIVHHYAKKHGIPYVLQAHGAMPSIVAKQRLKQMYDTIWGRKLLEDASKVIALTQTEAAQYKSMGVTEAKIEILPNGIDLSEFDNLPERGEFKKKYGLNDDEKIILYLGRIHKTKGLDLLVKAFAGLVEEIQAARLVIVGPDGGYLSILTKVVADLGVSDKVIFTGPLYERNRLGAYVDADVFVTPTFLGFPVTFGEACACGTPIITTEASDRLDWIHNQTGFVVPYEANQLKDAIAEVLTNRDLARQFQENEARLVKDRFTWPRITEELERIYLAVQAIDKKIPAGRADI